MVKEVILEFLEKDFYNSETSNYHRENGDCGVDASFDMKEHYTVNERFTTISKKYPHPSNYQFIELYYRNKDQAKPGWFVSNECTNNAYMFVYIDDVLGGVSSNTIRKAEYMLVPRARLIESILFSGLSEKILYTLVLKLKEENKNVTMRFGGISLICSVKKDRCRIGLLIDRKLLKRFSCFHKYYIM